MLKSKIKKNKVVFKKKSVYKDIPPINTVAFVHVFSTFNNTIITLCDIKGNTIFWSTSSSLGFKGGKKSNSYASQLAAETVGKFAVNNGYKNANIFIKGLGPGRDFSIRGISNSGVNILSVSDVTPTPHNGCKFKKIKRN